jgi:DNA polymerase-1
LEKAVTGNLSFANMGADGSGGSFGGNYEFDAQGSGGVSSENLAKKVIDVPKEDFEKTALALWLVDSGITNPQMEDVINFANKGDYEEAKKAIYIELDKKNLRKVYEEIELPLIPITKKMKERGIKIDRKLLAHLGTTYHAEVEKLEKKIHELAGTDFNISSPKQLGEILFDKLELVGKNMKKTSGGARSTKESELEKLRDLHPIVPLIFEYRELSKLLSTYIDAIPPLLDTNDRLHSHFVSAGTTTGRMASIDPNLQNIPVKTDLGKAIRGAFVASEGYKLCSFDYSQIELRIAAFLSGDEKLLEIFRKGEDVHTSVASFVFKVSPEQVTSDMRRKAKVINFGIIYGMGVLALKQNLGTSRDDAQKFLNDYFETFSGLANYLNNVKAETARKGYTETFFGRRRYFEGINSKIPYIKASAERMAINAPIQGTEADVIKLAMIAIHKYIKENKLDEAVHPLLQVHDELVYEIKEDKAEEVATQIEKIMESVMDPKDTKGVVLRASKAIGNNWGELK